MLNSGEFIQYKALIQGNKIEDAKKLLLSCINDNALVYRYFRGNNRDFHSVKTNNLWMSNAAYFNDPYDCAFLIKVYEGTYDSSESEKALSDWILQREADERAARRQSSTFVLSFSQLHNSLPMWGYYASDHRGFCVGYKLKTLIEQFNCFPVIYSDDLPSTNVDEDYYMEIALTKNTQWSHEKEWRIVRYDSKQKGKNGVFLQFCTPSEIIVGCNNHKSIIDELMPCHFNTISDYHKRKKVGLKVAYKKRDTFALGEKNVE